MVNRREGSMKEKRASEQIKNILNSSPAIIFLWKAEYNWPVDFVSDNISQFGYSPDEFLDGYLEYADIIHPDDKEMVEKNLNLYMHENKYKGFSQQYRILTKVGDIHWVDERTLVRRNKEGKATHYQGIIFDITENKKVEELLQINKKRLTTLLELNQMSNQSVRQIMNFALEEGIKLTKSDIGHLGFLNQSETAFTIHASSEHSMKNHNVEEEQHLYPVEEASPWGEVIERKESIITNEYKSSSPKKCYQEGDVEVIRYLSVPILEGNKVVAIAGVGNKKSDYNETDLKQLQLLMEGMWKIIQRKQIEHSLEMFSEEFGKAENGLKSINGIKKEFLRLKDSSYASNNNEDIINQDTLASLNQQQDKAVEATIRESEKMKSIVDFLLYMSREHAGQNQYNMSNIDILELMDKSLLDVSLRIDEKNIKIIRNIPKVVSNITGDYDKIKDTFTRIIGSSIKFLETCGTMKISVYEDTDHVHFELEDNGTGIPESVTSNLFMRFYNIEDAIENSAFNKIYEELKADFYISRSIIEAHDGTINIESEENKGTKVHLKLPKRNNI
jgi:PAS domain S-box-containing protein